MKTIFSKEHLSQNIFFALLFSAGLIAFAFLFGFFTVILARCIVLFANLITNSYHTFPFYTVLTIIVFWIWLGYSLIPSDDD